MVNIFCHCMYFPLRLPAKVSACNLGLSADNQIILNSQSLVEDPSILNNSTGAFVTQESLLQFPWIEISTSASIVSLLSSLVCGTTILVLCFLVTRSRVRFEKRQKFQQSQKVAVEEFSILVRHLPPSVTPFELKRHFTEGKAKTVVESTS